MQHRELYMTPHVHFIEAGDVNFPLNYCCATFNIFVWLTVTCSSKYTKNSLFYCHCNNGYPKAPHCTVHAHCQSCLRRCYCSFSFRHSESFTSAVGAFYWQSKTKWGKNRNSPWVIRFSEDIRKLTNFFSVEYKYETYLMIENSFTYKSIVVTDSTRTIRIKQWNRNPYYSHLQNRSNHSYTHHGESFSVIMD